MQPSRKRYNLKLRGGWAVTFLVCALVLSCAPAQTSRVEAAGLTQATPPSSGLVCTTSPNASFTLTAQTGYISTPDGNTIFMWSYSPDATSFQYPGPFLCVNQGDTVTVTLKNTLPEDVSIIFPGQQDVLANGIPSQPQYLNGELTSFTNVAAKGGGTVTYSFVAKEPGTYLYESGTDIEKQIQMGLFGGLVVRPSGHPDQAYANSGSKFNPSTEFTMLLSEIDPDLHQAIERGTRFDITTYHPRYWMINGRSFPDTIADNGAAWLPTQPYGALVHMQPKSASNPDPALVRYLNVGMRNHPFHPHGNNGRVIGRDGSALVGPIGEDLSYEKYLVLVGSSQTWDVTYDWTDTDLWKPNTNPIPVTIPSQQDLTFKDSATWYSGSPYLGIQDELPVGVTSYNECGEYYHVWHSHALNEAANYDTGFGGMFTLQRIDPPSPNTCP